MTDYAGKYLSKYERSRYTFLDRQTWLDNFIIVPPDAETFADLSLYQRGTNWVVYRQNARAAILKIGQGNWKDPAFEEHYRQARENGVILGGYWFYDGRYSPSEQARVCIEAMQGKNLEMELFVDWEHNYGGSYEGLRYVVTLMKMLESAGLNILDVGQYTGYYWFTENSALDHEYFPYLATKPLWLAWYAAASMVRVPLPWINWTNWQLGTPEIDWGQPTEELDMNKNNGTRSEFEARYLGGATPPTGETMKGVVNSGYTLIIRDSAGADINKRLYSGDTVYGTVTNSRIYFERVYRANGTVEATAGNATTIYMTLTNEAEPVSDSIEIVLLENGVTKRYKMTGTWEIS